MKITLETDKHYIELNDIEEDLAEVIKMIIKSWDLLDPDATIMKHDAMIHYYWCVLDKKEEQE